MKWPAIVIGSFLAVGLAVMLIVFALHKGQSSPAPQAPAPVATKAPPQTPRADLTPAPPPGNAAAVSAARAESRPARASSPLLNDPSVLTGTLRTVDASGALGYLPVGSDVTGPAPVTPKGLLVNPSTQITLDGKPANVAALHPGMDIAFLDNGDKPLEKLEAFGLMPDGKTHVKQGPIEKISSEQVVLMAGRKDLFPVALTIAGEIPTTIDGKIAKIADLRYRMLVAVKYLGTEAQSIDASTMIMDGAPHHADGNLAAAADSNGFTIRVYGTVGFDIQLKSAPNFKIQRETGTARQPTLEDATLADLQSGVHVVATYVNGIASDITIKLGRTAPARGGRGAAPAPATGPNVGRP